MYTYKLHAGSKFPDINVQSLSGEKVNLSAPQEGCDWKLLIVYRGQHCPLCTKYLNELEQYATELANNGVAIIAISADNSDQLTSHLEKLTISFPITYGLTTAQMQELGLYISAPRSAEETDHYFAEPGLFIINEHGTIQVIDISNNPFSRPQLSAVVSGINWIRDPNNNYPIRGTVPYKD